MRAIIRGVVALAVVAIGAVAAAPANAQDTTVMVADEITYYPTAEIGVQAGVLNGLSGKYWLSPFHGIQAGFTWRLPEDGYSVNVDYVAHSYVLHNTDREPPGMKVPLYAGAGIKALRLSGDERDPVWGARFPVGANALFDVLPVSVFAEIAPGAVFEEEGPQFSADASVGARVYF